MTAVLREQLNRLADVLTNLKDRVRLAVASELARAVSGAVQEVIQAVVSGRHDHEETSFTRPRSRTAWDDDDDNGWGRTADRWPDDRSDDDDFTHANRHDEVTSQPTNPGTITTAVAASVSVARWWLLRHGTLYSAAWLGLGVGILGVLGGPLMQTVIGLLAATAEVLTVTESLGDGAARLEHL